MTIISFSMDCFNCGCCFVSQIDHFSVIGRTSRGVSVRSQIQLRIRMVISSQSDVFQSFFFFTFFLTFFLYFFFTLSRDNWWWLQPLHFCLFIYFYFYFIFLKLTNFWSSWYSVICFWTRIRRRSSLVPKCRPISIF